MSLLNCCPTSVLRFTAKVFKVFVSVNACQSSPLLPSAPSSQLQSSHCTDPALTASVVTDPVVLLCPHLWHWLSWLLLHSVVLYFLGLLYTTFSWVSAYHFGFLFSLSLSSFLSSFNSSSLGPLPNFEAPWGYIFSLGDLMVSWF